MREYDLIADWYAKDRGLGVQPEIASLLASLPLGAVVLDVGCGTGIPLTQALLAAGCKVVGVDSSPRMLEHFRINCPDVRVICAPIQSTDFEGMTFDAAVAWGVLFHMDHAEQEKVVAKVAEVLKPGGWFLFTSGDQEGSIQGEPMNGVPFRYWSFSMEGYRHLLKANAFALIDVHRDQGDNIYYLARKDDGA